MAERVVLHIGVQKSGTTYLQQLMQHRTHELAEIGVKYQLPSGRRLKHGRVNHHELATYGLLGTEYPWVSSERAAAERGWWGTLASRVHDWPGTAIISAEALSVVRADAARRVIDALGGPSRTDVVITARGLGKLLPSMWQQHIRNGRSASCESFFGRLARERSLGWNFVENDPETSMWRAFALGRLADRWAGIVGAQRVRLITNPGSPAELLWHRFLEAAAVDNASQLPAPEKTTVHTGVTAAEAEVLNSINVNLSAAGWLVDAIKSLDNKIIRAFGERKQRGPKLGVTPAYRELVAQWSHEDIADLGRTGVRIVGATDELRYSPNAEADLPVADDVAAAAGVAVRVATEMNAEPARIA